MLMSLLFSSSFEVIYRLDGTLNVHRIANLFDDILHAFIGIRGFIQGIAVNRGGKNISHRAFKVLQIELSPRFVAP